MNQSKKFIEQNCDIDELIDDDDERVLLLEQIDDLRDNLEDAGVDVSCVY